MDKEILTVATFEENCEYQSSTSSRKVALPQQLVQVNLSDPINMEEHRPPNTFCYDDKIKLIANVTYANDNSVFIQTGRIEFYFIPEGTKKPILINKAEVSYNNNNEPNIKQTCELNNEGTAAVYFKPTDSGKVFAKYIDDNEIYTTANSEEIDLILQGIPVNIKFDKLPPYIADVHDEVTIRVHVTNAHDGTDIRYGLVTFLHYLDYNDENTPNKRIPNIIGNPVPVFDGYAEISYIPVQSDDYDYTDTEQNTEPEVLQEETLENFYEKRNIEYIMASYNYSGKYIDTEKESYKWKYYNTNSKWTAISVLARNAINVNPPRINKTALALNGEKGVYQCKESDTITLSAILKDKNNEIIDFSDGYTGKLTFHIKGTHPHPKKPHTQNRAPQTYLGDYTQTSEEFEFMRYEEDIEAELSDNTYEFIAQINKPLPGFYNVSATTTIMTQKSNLPLIDAENIKDDKKYAEVTNSNTIYISSEYDDILQNIVLQHDTYFNQTKENINNLIGNVYELTNNQMNILNNKTCYFYVSETNETYRGTLTYNSDTNKLTGEPSEDIAFNTSGDYHISMYIPYGVYTDDTSVTEYHHDIDSVHDFYLPYYSSVPITMQIRDAIELELSIDTISNTIPGNFLYTLSGKYIKDEVSVDIFKKATGSSVEDKITNGLQLFRQYNKITDTFEINQVGTYEIYAKTQDGIQSKTVEIEVKRESLNQTLLESSKKIFASVDTTIGVYLTCLENNINLVNEEKIHAYLYDKNKSNEKPVNIIDTRIINDKTMYLEIAPKIWQESTWYIKVTYDEDNEGDENFSQYNGILEKFTSVLDTPTVTLIPYNNNYKVNIQSPHFKKQFFVILVNFWLNNASIKSGVYITNQDGLGSFGANVNNLDWWGQWNNISFTFDPCNADLIEILKNNKYPHEALESKYRLVFDEHNIAQNSDQLLQQLRHNNCEYIYDTYKYSHIRIGRPTSL